MFTDLFAVYRGFPAVFTLPNLAAHLIDSSAVLNTKGLPLKR